MKDLYITSAIYSITLVCFLIHANIYRKELTSNKVRDNILISARLLVPFLLFSVIFRMIGVSVLSGYLFIVALLWVSFAAPSFCGLGLLLIVFTYIFYEWSFGFPDKKYWILAPKLSRDKTDKDQMDCLIGQTGTSVTDLKPSGKVLVNESEYEARCEDGFLNRNEPIKVVDKKAFGLIVRKLDCK